MERATFSKYSWIDFAFSVIGVCTFLVDWGSDVWVATEFYCRGDIFWFGVLVGLMVLSSVVVQMFSWFWFQYDRKLPGFGSVQTGGGTVLFGDRVKLSCLFHVLQLGFLCRHISAIRQGFRVWWRKVEGSEYAVYLTHDLSMLRLIETFCESAPQLTLMIYVMLQTNKARTVQFVSIAASTTSIAWMVVDYHRSLRSFLPDKAKQGWCSSLIYFLWNLLLIAPRVAALALFASVLSGYIGAHFLMQWASSFHHLSTSSWPYLPCEHCCLHHLHRLDGGGLPPLAALLPPRQGQAGLVFLFNLLPVEPAANRPACGGPRPLRLGPVGVHRRSLPDAVVRLRVLGLAAGDPLYGQPGWGVAVPLHCGAHLVLQLVQCGRGTHQRQEHHLPHLHHH
ncbi:XK-related protein 8.3 isoform X1 [Trematomus bernacchii]|uniref:XK-related protein 8.3 isoform X1 n=1 Tax=Trematomus bernacchii TaxID=40690 RepID=UPI00146F6B82|nr:XK-related protein 8.3 isoform X1 [Trematomus bernacchii]